MIHFCYFISFCVISSQVKNLRTLNLIDINDNKPVFEKNEYITTVSEVGPVRFPSHSLTLLLRKM